LTTEKGTLVTRRNGKVAILGNCGRGFRLHPGKEDCLVLDFGGNVMRHGPVDALEIKDSPESGTGEAPAKECPQCHAVIAAGFATCPQCGYAFPEPEGNKHSATATKAGIISGQTTTEKHDVTDVYYCVHVKRGAKPGDPRTMRVEYRLGITTTQSEWICINHSGYAFEKARHWWRKRSKLPMPDTVEEAVALARSGALCETRSITIRSVAGEKYDRIVGYDLGPIPDYREPGWDEEPETVADFEYQEVPF
jgi:DNA repair protein RadD